MLLIRLAAIALIPALTVSGPLFAAEPAAGAAAYFAANVAPWIGDEVIVAAVLAQNARTEGLAQADINALDLQWRAEAKSTDMSAKPLMQSVLTGPVADFVVERLNTGGSAITEVFVMDARGLNVAAATETSDYWQGDEEKFTESFSKGAGAMHISDVDLDESSQIYVLQVSVPLLNPADGSVIGAITVGLNAEGL